jgi:hypothetical protein
MEPGLIRFSSFSILSRALCAASFRKRASDRCTSTRASMKFLQPACDDMALVDRECVLGAVHSFVGVPRMSLIRKSWNVSLRGR